jgi:internalin A
MNDRSSLTAHQRREIERSGYLDLSDHGLTSLPPEICQLTSLHTLRLSGNQLTALPPEICQLTSLHTLRLSGNQLTALPPEICQLTNLHTLLLDKNQLTTLPLEICRLTSLHTLRLSGIQLTTVPPEIGQLTGLQALSLDKNQLTTLPPQIGQLTELQTLTLTENQFATVPPEICQLTRLQKLCLDKNQLTTLPPQIGQLTELQTLTLTDNQLTALPPEIADSLDAGLIIQTYSNPLVEPLPELIKQGNGAVAVYLRSLVDGIAHYEAKVVLVGEGNVGKTSLSAALCGDAFIEGRPFTHGIEIRPLALKHPSADRDITIKIWDFGGQEVYRITHQFFFSPRALYLVVWKPREGQEQNEVEGWLRRIRLRVGPDARVLIVATHCANEQYPDLDYPLLQREFPRMLAGHFEVDNQTGLGIPELRSVIAREAARLPQMGQKISSRWTSVRDEVTDFAQSKPQISFSDFVTICRRHLVSATDFSTLATLMHDLGQVIYYGADESLQDFVVLNPEWLTKAISYVLRDGLTRGSGGVLDHARLQDIWQDRPDGSGYPSRYHRYFLRLMEKFDISYRLDEQHSLVAQLVPYQRPDLPWDSHTPLPKRLRRLSLVCQLSEPAPGLMPWLTVRHHDAATGRHWRTGVFLRHPIPAYDSDALVELRTPERLAVEVRAPSPDHYFHVLTDSIVSLIRNRWPGLIYNLSVPCPTVMASGSWCSHLLPMKDLLSWREEGETRYLCASCRVWHDVSVLLTGFPAEVRPLQAEISQQLDRVENHLIRIEDKAADIAAVIRRILRVVSTEITDCPRLFTLIPNQKADSRLRQVYRHRFRLTLWCEHPESSHPWDNASYEIETSREWLTKVTPYAALVLRTLQLVVPLAGSIAVASLPVDQIEKAAAHLEVMKTLLEELPNPSRQDSTSIGPSVAIGQMSAAEGDALRTLRVLIFEHDKMRKFGGLRRVFLPSGDFLWICPLHYAQYDPGLPLVP